MDSQLSLLRQIPLPEPDRQEMANFCREGSDRFGILTESLRRRGISHEVIPLGDARHIALPVPNASGLDGEYYRVTLIAHYDRVEGTPGANDNTAAVFQLLAHWEDMHRLGWKHRTQIIFTDKEEITGDMRTTDQGSWRLAQRLHHLGVENILFFVLDMCGIGDTPVWGRSIAKIGLNSISGAVSRAHLVMESFLKRYTSGADYGVNPMFSDDLGLLLGGYPALQLSLLPSAEARELAMQHGSESAAADRDAPARFRDQLRNQLPHSWRSNHGPEDDLASLDRNAFLLMQRLLRDLARYRFPLP